LNYNRFLSLFIKSDVGGVQKAEFLQHAHWITTPDNFWHMDASSTSTAQQADQASLSEFIQFRQKRNAVSRETLQSHPAGTKQTALNPQ